MRMGRPASEIMAMMAGKEDEWQESPDQVQGPQAVNDPCPCGSGLKFGECHGWVRPDRGRKAPWNGRAAPASTGAREELRTNDE